MALIGDIFGGPSKLTIGEAGNEPIVMDALVRETHSLEGEVSDHPVESGVDIVDHYRVKPRALEIEGVVTDSPLTVGLPGASLLNSAAALLNGDETPSANAWQEFQRFFDDAVVLTIVTSLKVKQYSSMVLTRLDVTRDVGTAHGLYFTLNAREIQFTDTETGDAIAIPLPDVTVGQSTQNKAKVTNSTANAAETSESSFLHNIIHGGA